METEEDDKAEKRRKIALAKNLGKMLLNKIQEGVFIFDAEGRFDRMNPAAEELLGASIDQVKGADFYELVRFRRHLDNALLDNPVQTCLNGPPNLDLNVGNLIMERKDGQLLDVELSGAPVLNDQSVPEGAILILRDMRPVTRLKKNLDYYTKHDPLTGIKNREEFEAHLIQAIQEAISEKDSLHTLCYIGLEQFKLVNSSCGNMGGDELLRQTAHIIKDALSQGDFLGRLGGDEFGVLFRNTPEKERDPRIQKLLDAFNDYSFTWETQQFKLSAGFGLVHINEESRGLQNILNAASSSCDLAKKKGRNSLYVFQSDDSEMTQRADDIRWTRSLKSALQEKDRFQIYFQTVLPLSRAAAGLNYYELLLRFKNEKNEYVSPAEFIPAAEQYNLMMDIDRWVIKSAFSAISALASERELNGAVFAINLSGQSIGNPGMLDYILRQLEEHKVEPGHICLEVTETAAVTNLNNAIRFINTLQNTGCKFSLDDFGTGVSSFTYLKELPVNFLKIDGHFIKGMAEDPLVYALVESINNIGHVMNIQTIAEFVGDNYTIMLLQDIGVDYIQGFFNGKPRHFGEIFAENPEEILSISENIPGL